MSKVGIALFTRVNSFVEALINMVSELKKLLQGLKKLCKNAMVIPHSIRKLLANKQFYSDDEKHI